MMTPCHMCMQCFHLASSGFDVERVLLTYEITVKYELSLQQMRFVCKSNCKDVYIH